MAKQRLSMESDWDDMAQCDSANHNLSGGANLTMRDLVPEAMTSQRPSYHNPQVHTEDCLDVSVDLRADVGSEALQRLNRHACDHAPQSWPAASSSSSSSSTVSSGETGPAAAMLLGPEIQFDDGGIGHAGRWMRQQRPCTPTRGRQSSTRRSLSAGDVRQGEQTIWAASIQAQVGTIKPAEAIRPPSPGRPQTCANSQEGASHQHQHPSFQQAGHPSCIRVLPRGDPVVPLAMQPRQQHEGGRGSLAGWPGSHSGTAAVAGKVVRPLQRKWGSCGLDGWPGSNVGSAMAVGSGRQEPAWPQTTGGPAPAGPYRNGSAGRSGSSSAQSQSSHGVALRLGTSRTPREPCSAEEMSHKAMQPSAPVEHLAASLRMLPQGRQSGLPPPVLASAGDASPQVPHQAGLPHISPPDTVLNHPLFSAFSQPEAGSPASAQSGEECELQGRQQRLPPSTQKGDLSAAGAVVGQPTGGFGSLTEKEKEDLPLKRPQMPGGHFSVLAALERFAGAQLAGMAQPQRQQHPLSHATCSPLLDSSALSLGLGWPQPIQKRDVPDRSERTCSIASMPSSYMQPISPPANTLGSSEARGARRKRQGQSLPGGKPTPPATPDSFPLTCPLSRMLSRSSLSVQWVTAGSSPHTGLGPDGRSPGLRVLLTEAAVPPGGSHGDQSGPESGSPGADLPAALPTCAAAGRPAPNSQAGPGKGGLPPVRPAVPPDHPEQWPASHPIEGLGSLLHSTISGQPASHALESLLHSTDSGRHDMQSLFAALAGLGYDTVSPSALQQIRQAVSSLRRPPSPEGQGSASHRSLTHSAGYTVSAGHVHGSDAVQDSAWRYWSLTAPSTAPSPRPSNHHPISLLAPQHPQPLIADHSIGGQTQLQRGGPARGGAWKGQAPFLDRSSASAFAADDFLLQADAPYVAYSLLAELDPVAHGQRAPWSEPQPFGHTGPQATSNASNPLHVQRELDNIMPFPDLVVDESGCLVAVPPSQSTGPYSSRLHYLSRDSQFRSHDFQGAARRTPALASPPHGNRAGFMERQVWSEDGSWQPDGMHGQNRGPTRHAAGIRQPMHPTPLLGPADAQHQLDLKQQQQQQQQQLSEMSRSHNIQRRPPSANPSLTAQAHGDNKKAPALAPVKVDEIARGQPPQPRLGPGLLLLGMCVLLLANMMAMIKVWLHFRQVGSPTS